MKEYGKVIDYLKSVKCVRRSDISDLLHYQAVFLLNRRRYALIISRQDYFQHDKES